MEDEIFRVLHEDELSNTQTRLTVSEFRGIEYLSIRKYYRDFDGDWKPGKEGVNIPLSIACVQNLFRGALDLMAETESKEVFMEEFYDLVVDLIENNP